MSLEVTMPQMGESVVEGTVTKWLVKEGDRVNEDQPLCEISTDKVDTEIPSPGSGIIARLLASEGQTCQSERRWQLLKAAQRRKRPPANPLQLSEPLSHPSKWRRHQLLQPVRPLMRAKRRWKLRALDLRPLRRPLVRCLHRRRGVIPRLLCGWLKNTASISAWSRARALEVASASAMSSAISKRCAAASLRRRQLTELSRHPPLLLSSVLRHRRLLRSFGRRFTSRAKAIQLSRSRAGASLLPSTWSIPKLIRRTSARWRK